MDTAESFVALVIYPSTPQTQVGLADTLFRMTEATLRSMPGFVGARVFLSESGDSVVSLVEWRDRESFARFRTSEFGLGGTQMLSELRPSPHWLRPYATVEAP